VELPYRAARANIAESVQWLIHLGRSSGRRELLEFERVPGYDFDSDRFETETLYRKGV
jgi:hypothetical protein